MLNRYVLAAFLILAGSVLLMTNLMFEPLSLTFWNSVMAVIGLGFILNALILGPRWFQLGLGLYVGGIGLFNMLAPLELVSFTGHEVFRQGWPILVIAMGLGAIFPKRKWTHWKTQWIEIR